MSRTFSIWLLAFIAWSGVAFWTEAAPSQSLKGNRTSSDAPKSREPEKEIGAADSSQEPSQPALTVAPQKVFVAGNEFVLPATAKLANGEVLAPLSEALPQLDAKVEFRPSDKSLHITSAAGTKLSLYANNRKAFVKDKFEEMPVAPTFDGVHFFLPVFATAKALDYAARVDKAGALHLFPTLTTVQVSTSEQAVEVRMVLSAPVKYTVNELQDSLSKVYVDLAQTVLALPPGEAWTPPSPPLPAGARGGSVVQRVRVGQFTDDPPVTRVVVDMTRRLWHIVRNSDRSNELVIILSLTTMPSLPSLPPVEVTGDELKGVKIVVDAGHGGKDPGASGNNGTLEKNITLDIALRLRVSLAQRGATVLMTRTGDSYPTLDERVSLANRSGAHIFVSVHVNAWPKPNGHSGTEIYYYTPQSLSLARCIHDRMIMELQRRDGGVRRRRFYVIRNTVMPSVLTETAYINHDEEEALLNDPDFRQRAAEAMANGIVDYVQQYRK